MSRRRNSFPESIQDQNRMPVQDNWWTRALTIRRGHARRRYRIAPSPPNLDNDSIFGADMTPLASTDINSENSDDLDNSIPIADSLDNSGAIMGNPNIAYPLGMQVAEIVPDDKKCCLPGMFSGCRFCPPRDSQIAPYNGQEMMQKRAGKKLKKRRTRKTKLKKRNYTRRRSKR